MIYYINAADKKLDFLIAFLQKFKRLNLVIVFVIFDHITSALYSLFFTANNPIDKMGLNRYEILFIVSVFSPIIETVIFQTFIINITIRLVKSEAIAILISAVAFGLAHNYSTAYAIKAFSAGILYGILYIVCRNHNAIFYVILAHSSYNFVGFFIYEILPNIIQHA